MVAVSSQAHVEVVHKSSENQARFRIGEAIRVTGVKLAGISQLRDKRLVHGRNDLILAECQSC